MSISFEASLLNSSEIVENKGVSSSLESEIRLLLLEHGDPARAVEPLLRRWESNVLNTEEIRTLTRFLLAAGMTQTVLVHIARALKRDHPIPWSALIESLKLSKVEIEPIEIDALFEGAAANEGGLDDLVDSTALDPFDPRTEKLRLEKRDRLKRAHQEKRDNLIRRLDYARVNRLIQQEKKVLDEIQAFDPEDPELKKEKSDFAFREAQNIVEDALSQSPPKTELERQYSKLPAELVEASKPILREIQRRAPEATEAEVYDMAMMLLFMELHQESARLIERRRLSERLDWLLLEVLILGRQYASALGEIEKLEIKYAGDPETPFALTYARARALWGLGESLTAIELMRSLTKVRPGYRSCNTLLQQWSEEAP